MEYISLARDTRDRIKNEETDADPEKKYNERKKEIKRNVELILSDGSIYEELGKVDFIDRNINAMTGSMLVQSTFPNPDQILRPGMYGKVRIEFGVSEGALLVPQRCVTELQGQYSVYVIEEGNVVKSRQVKATEKYDDLWMIEEGLNAGEKVVYEGLQKVATGVVITPELVEYVTPDNQ
jgi:membrane fusion protein (multidrug efflux system)